MQVSLLFGLVVGGGCGTVATMGAQSRSRLPVARRSLTVAQFKLTSQKASNYETHPPQRSAMKKNMELCLKVS